MNLQWRRDFLRRVSATGAIGALAGAAEGGVEGGGAADANLGWPQTETERAVQVMPQNVRFAPGDVRRYGADPSGSRDSSQAFLDANTAATRGGGPVRVASGHYKYAPMQTLNLSVSWLGDGAAETIILCDTTKFSGEFFRMVGSTELRDLLFKATGPEKRGTGIRLAPVDAARFTGHVRLTRVWMLGFNYNIQCDNNFEVTFDQVRSAMGNEGFYCAPETAEGNGYCTTHLHLNCYYAENTRNVYYSPSVRYAFRTITFLGGAIEGATGDSSQASFTRCSPIKFIQIYLEAAASIPALVLNDCVASIDGAYLGGTGGVRIGSNTKIDLRQVLAMSASDVFSGGDGSQQVSMQDCVWPKSGNSLGVARIALRNTSINGAMYDECAQEIAVLGAIRFNRQRTLAGSNAAQDVYRFLDAAGELAGGSVAGRFEVVAKDKGDHSNQAVYEYWLGSASGGTAHAALVQVQKLVRGVDVGASAEPLVLASDGDRGGVKLQFLKSSMIQQVIVDVLFYGILIAK